jgi:hypothetical protein
LLFDSVDRQRSHTCSLLFGLAADLPGKAGIRNAWNLCPVVQYAFLKANASAKPKMGILKETKSRGSLAEKKLDRLRCLSRRIDFLSGFNGKGSREFMDAMEEQCGHLDNPRDRPHPN